MPLKFRRKVILAKNAASYGADAAPTAAANAILVDNFSIRPLQQEYDDREYDVPYFGNKGRIPSGSFVELSFEVEMAGAGAVDSAPKYGPLLQSCGMSETITPTTGPVTYAPITTGEKDSTIYFYIDGRLHKVLGAFGNVEARLVAGRRPKWAFTFIGLYVLPSDTALPTPTLTGFQKPPAVNNTNTTPATLFTFAGKFREITLATGNELVYRNLPNSEAVRFVNRRSRGSVRLEDELVATKDWWTIVKNGTLGALTVTQGTAAGNKVTITANQVQLTEPDMSEEQGIAMIRMNMELQPSSAGNDEWSIATQ
jgi:hypothetical protein